MSKTYQTTLLIRGDSKNAVREVKLTRDELEKLTGAQKKAGDEAKSYGQKLAKSLEGGRDKFNQAAKTAAKWGAAVAAAGVAAGAAIVKSGLESVDSLAKTADKLGIATEELAKLRFAAEQTGVSQQTLDMALQRYTRRMGEATMGYGEARKALDALGLSADELSKLPLDEQMKVIAQEMNKVEDQSQKLAIATKFFDSEGVALVNTLAAGADGLEQFGLEATAAGLAIDRDMAAKVEAANDAMNRVSTMTDGFSQQLAVQFAPVLEGIASRLFNTTTETTDMGDTAETVFNAVISAAGFLGDAIRGLEIVFLTLKAGVATMAAGMVSAFDLVLSKAAEVAEYLPGVDLDYENSGFAMFAESLRTEAVDAAQAVQDKLNEPLPSTQLEKFAKESNEALESVAKSATDTGTAIGVDMPKQVNIAETASEKYIKKLEDQKTALGLTGREQAVFNAVTKLGADATDEQRAAVAKLAGEMFDLEAEQKAAGEAAKQSAIETENLTTVVQRGFERMRDGVGDFFQNLILDGKASFDDLIDLFKQMIAELIATAATNRILLSFGLAGGSAGASAGIPGAGGSGGLDILSTLGGGGVDFLTGAAAMLPQGLQNFFVNGAGNLAQSGAGILNSFGVEGFTQGGAQLTGALATAGAGFAGGYAGTAIGENVFGKTAGSNYGATAGSIIGGLTPLGPLGAAIGGFLGGGLDAAFGSSNSDKWVNYQFNGGDIEQTRDTGKPLSQDAAQIGVDIAKMIADALGPSDADFEISGGRKSGVRIDGQVFGDDIEAAAERIFDLILAGATELSEGVKELGSEFTGSTDQALMFVQALDVIDESVGQTGLDMVDAFQGTAEETLAYSLALAGLSETMGESGLELVKAFDGTTEETVAYALALTNMAGTMTESSVELITAFEGTAAETIAYAAALSGLSLDLSESQIELVKAFEGTAEETASYALALSNMTGELTESQIEMITSFQGTAAEAAAFVTAIDGVAQNVGETGLFLVDSFQGTAEETLAYAQALSGLSGTLTESQAELVLAFEGTAAETASYAQALIDMSLTLTDTQTELVMSFQGTADETAAYALALSSMTNELEGSQLLLVQAFQGTADEAVAYIAVMDLLTTALDQTPVTDARIAYEASNVTLLDAYTSQATKLDELTTGYDGSLAATTELTTELDRSQQMAFALATQLLAASDQIGALTEASAASIRQSVLDEEELRAAREAEINALAAELETLSDPDEIASTVADLERLNRQVFDSLGPEAQKEQAEAFAGFIEQVNTTAQERLAAGIADLEATQTEITASIGTALDAAAGNMVSAGDTQSLAANLMNTAASAMQAAANTPIKVDVAPVQVSVSVNVPGKAEGGMASGLTLVGEEGPELVNFNRPGYVYTAGETRAMMGSSDEVVQNLNRAVAELKNAAEHSAVNAAKSAKYLKDIRDRGTGIYNGSSAA